MIAARSSRLVAPARRSLLAVQSVALASPRSLIAPQPSAVSHAPLSVLNNVRFQQYARTFRSSAIAPSQGTWAKKGPIAYDELRPLAKQPSGDVTLIDVREPDEVQAGMIPSAVSVPLTQFEKAFDPNGGGNFEKDYAFPRPGFNDAIVFYCRSGKRSAQAQEIARRNGWSNTRNYEGSWLDWVANEEKSGGH